MMSPITITLDSSQAQSLLDELIERVREITPETDNVVWLEELHGCAVAIGEAIKQPVPYIRFTLQVGEYVKSDLDWFRNYKVIKEWTGITAFEVTQLSEDILPTGCEYKVITED